MSLKLLSTTKPYDDFEEWKERLQLQGIYDDVSSICRQEGVLLEEVYSDARMAPPAKARARVMLYCRNVLHWSYPYIGKFMRRDHTTVRVQVTKLQAAGKANR